MKQIKNNPAIVQSSYSEERTIVLIPSISFSPYVLADHREMYSFEERYLYFLRFLKEPKTRLLVVLSEGIETLAVRYFLDHMRRAIGRAKVDVMNRLRILTVPTYQYNSLTKSILDDPNQIRRIKKYIDNPQNTFVEFFTVTKDEIELAKRLGLAHYGLPEEAIYVNTKSGARSVFAMSGVPHARGASNIRSLRDIYMHTKQLVRARDIDTLVLKIDDGAAGSGFVFIDAFHALLPYDQFVDALARDNRETFDSVMKYIEQSSAVLEEFIGGDIVHSPSVQFEIYPHGHIEYLATHDQVLDGTVYTGVHFPARGEYRREIVKVGMKIARTICNMGAIGVVAFDLLAVYREGKWNIYAIEINARKGGTNHTYMWAKYLTNSVFHPERGMLVCDKGDVVYRGTEDFTKESRLGDVDLKKFLKAFCQSGLDFDHNTKQGVFIHMLSSLKSAGTFGATIIGRNRQDIEKYWSQMDAFVINYREKT